MNSSKFIQKLKELFDITPHEDESNKKTIKELIKKLKLRHIVLKKELKSEIDVTKREALKDSIQIIKKQINKGKEILDK